MNKIVVIDEKKCTSCGICVKICPLQILYLDKKSRKCKVTDENKCDKLKGCERVCKQNAIKIV